MSRYRDDRDDDRHDDIETRRGRTRSFAEEKFYEAQRERERYVHPDDDTRQFDWGSGDREQQERDRHMSERLGTTGDRQRRYPADRSDYYRPPVGDTGMRYDRHYEGRDDPRPDRSASGTVRRGAQTQDDYGRREQPYRDDRDRDDRSHIMPPARPDEREPRGSSRSHVRCRDIMTRDVTVARRDTTLGQIARMMRDEDTGVIPVVEGEADATSAAADQQSPQTNTGEDPRARRNERSYGKLAGLITDRDIVVRAVAEGKDPQAVRADEIMTADVHTAEPNDRVIDAIRKMGDKQVRRIPVCDAQGNLRGIISMADVALETEADRELANALEEISSGSSFWGKMFG